MNYRLLENHLATSNIDNNLHLNMLKNKWEDLSFEN